MGGQCYLLSLEKFFEGAGVEAYFREAFDKVDEVRRKRAERMRTKEPRAACLGAGLLLQLAVQEALEETRDGKICTRTKADQDMELPGREEYPYQLSVYTVPGILGLLGQPLDLEMYYGEKGKPYLRDYPFYFNLSHSGNYVVCALSRQEVGVDIQQYRRTDIDRLADRFFSAEEKDTLKACHDRREREQLFYQLWTRKEAYGKLTGQGIAAVIDKSVLPAVEGGLLAVEGAESAMEREKPAIGEKQLSADAEDAPPLFWQEWTLEGYGIALCQYGS